MIVLLDTNVLISAAFRDRVPERVVLYVATREECQWVVTPAIVEEYRQVLARPKFALSLETQAQWAALFESRSAMLDVELPAMNFPRDPKDQPFLAAAFATGADFLITGDSDLLDAHQFVTTRILTVAEFAHRFAIK